MTDKVCVDCKHYEYQKRLLRDSLGEWLQEFHYCNFKSPYVDIDLVTGKPKRQPQLICYEERELTGGCGPTGLNFEPKDIK